ncbi:MAG: hypothetical protein Q7R70_05645 [Candidatus Diapherotrites archaeon]|nr:hypothetical protein [Candidatus Diapherotrites archaeon]
MAGDFLKDLYFGMEEKYYAFLDHVDKVIPIYKIVDPIDKIVPTFAIVLAVIILALILGGWFLLTPLLAKPTVGVVLQVETVDGDPIANASIKLMPANLTIVTNSQGITERQDFEKDSVINYTVTKNGFETKTDKFTANEPKKLSIVLVELARGSLQKTIYIKDSFNRAILKSANYSFSCTNPGAIPEPAQITTSNGSASVKAPSNCGSLVASIEVEGFAPKQSIAFTSDSQTVQLEELESELSTIRARVVFDDKPLAGISVKLFEFELGPIAEQVTNASGIAEFKQPASKYTLRTSPTDEYGSKATDEFATLPGDTVQKTITLEKDISVRLKVQVVEKDNTGKKIANAKVTVKKGNARIDDETTDANGMVSFNLNATGKYTISADHPDYLVSEREIDIQQQGDRTESLVLEKFSASNSGELKVKVLDAETAKGVKAARVALYYGTGEDKEGFLTPYAEQLSDINGIAHFPNVKPATYYYAVAVKQGASGKSESQRFELRDASAFYLNVSLIVPNGSVKVNVKDTEGFAVANARVTLIDAFDNSEIGSSLTDSDGNWVLPATSRFAKADKEVFVKISRQQLNPGEKDYSAYTTISKPIIANKVTAFNVTLEPKILANDFKMEFLGLFKKDKSLSGLTDSDKATPAVSPGQEYVGKFRILVPAGKTYSQSIMHVHTGKGEFGYGIMEKDSMVLKRVNMPLSNNILKATSINKANGFGNDAATVTEGDAKWANIPVASLSEGVYEAEVSFAVKSTAAVGEQAGVYYWLTGVSNDGETIYYPRMEQVPSEDFYFEPPAKQLYQVGITTLCDSEFCFSANIIEDLNGRRGLGEAVDESYNAKILNNYKLIFNISNNSKTTVHNDAQLRIKNEDESLLFKSYSIILPSGREITGTAGKSQLPDQDITNSQNQNRFEKGAVISGEIDFTPQTSSNGIISFKIASSSNPPGLYNIVFQKDLTIVVSAQNEFKVDIQPTMLPAGIESNIEVSVTDAKTNLEVEGAIITVKDRFKNTLVLGKTTRLGKATVRIPSLLPGEEITVTISKPDYNNKELKLKANDQLLEISPATIALAINASTESQKSTTVQVKNIASFPLKIEKLEYSNEGTSGNFLDDTAMNNALAEQQGAELNPNGSANITFTGFLTQEALALTDRQQVKGTLTITAGNYGQSWVFKVPVNATIGFGAELDAEDCLQVTPKNWTDSTEGKAISFEFKIQNNCSSKGQPIAISDLQAKVEWNGNEIGTFLLGIYESKSSGAIAAAELRAGYFKKLVSRFEAEKSYDAILSFTPSGGVDGVANAKIIIQAKNKTEGQKDQAMSQEITTELHVANLKECISFSKELLSITKDEKIAESMTDFTISNKKDCGEVKVFLSVLPDNTLSLVGAPTSGLIIADGGTSPAIQVIANKSTFPGQYAIIVKAQLEGQPTPSEITSLIEQDKTIRVRVWDASICIQLDKYEFNVFDDPEVPDDGFDNSELTNYCKDKDVPFKVDMSSFANAATDGLKWGLLTALLGALTNGLSGSGVGNIAGNAQTNAALEQSITSMTAISTAITGEKTAACLTLANSEKTFGEGFTGGCTDVTTSSTGSTVANDKATTTQIVAADDGKTSKIGNETITPQTDAVNTTDTYKTNVSAINGSCFPKSDAAALDKSLLQQTIAKLNETSDCFTTLSNYCDNPASKAYMGATCAAVAKAKAAEIQTKFSLTDTGFTATSGTIGAIDTASTSGVSAKTASLVFQKTALDGVTAYGPKLAVPNVSEAWARTTAAKTIEEKIPTQTGTYKTSLSTEQGKIKTQQTDAATAAAVGTGLTYATAAVNLKKVATTLETEKTTLVESKEKTLGTYSGFTAATTSYGVGKSLLGASNPTASVAGVDSLTVTGLIETSKDNITNASAKLTLAKAATAAQMQTGGSGGQNSGSAGNGGVLGSLLGSGSGSSSSGGLLGGLGSVLIPGSAGFLGGLLGSTPLSQGVGVFIARTMYNINNQDTIEFTTTMSDLEISSFAMYPQKLTGSDTTDATIKVEQVGSTRTDNRIDSKLKDQSMELKFTNQDPLLTGTNFKLLKVNAERHDYADKTYSIDDIELEESDGGLLSFFDQPTEADIDTTDIELDEKTGYPKDASQYFMLQFNAISPEQLLQDTVIDPNKACVSFMPPGIFGNTGEEAVPKVLLDWSWQDVGRTACDEGTANYAFCDGVQFSIESLKKIKVIKDFLADNPLVCPSANVEEKTNTIGEDNIGISRLFPDYQIKSDGSADANIIVTVKNNAPALANIKLTVTVVNSSTQAALPPCIKTFDVSSETTIGCEFKSLQASTTFAINAVIEPTFASCTISNCNSMAADDSVSTAIDVRPSQLLTNCPPYKTSRLKEFIEATEKSGRGVIYRDGMNKESFLQNIKFNAYLTQDRYSPDLQKDFDDYYTNVAFVDTADWYTGKSGTEPGLGTIFKDFGKFKFGPKFSEAPDIGYMLPGPGLYETTIDIEFNNKDWQMFINGVPDAKVHVLLNKTPNQPALSPFYYLPFDGLVGTVDSENGRTMYGLNYKSTASDPVSITSDVGSSIKAIGGASWSPFTENGGVLETSIEQSFKKLNFSDTRGMIMSISKSKLVFSPSNATPVILKMTNNTGEACVTYNFAISGTDTYVGPESNPWWGVGVNCKDFYGRYTLEAFKDGFADKSTVGNKFDTACARSSLLAYGLEWPDTQQNFGSTYLKSIFYTPQGRTSSMSIDVANDSASLITNSTQSTANVPLTGAGNASNESIQSVRQILNMVRNRTVCVSGTGLEQKFWWNPTPIIQSIEGNEKSAESECIK